VKLQYGSDDIRVELIMNPSHLEAGNPVAMGRVRALQRQMGQGRYGDGDNKSVSLLVSYIIS